MYRSAYDRLATGCQRAPLDRLTSQWLSDAGHSHAPCINVFITQNTGSHATCAHCYCAVHVFSYNPLFRPSATSDCERVNLFKLAAKRRRWTNTQLKMYTTIWIRPCPKRESNSSPHARGPIGPLASQQTAGP